MRPHPPTRVCASVTESLVRGASRYVPRDRARRALARVACRD